MKNKILLTLMVTLVTGTAYSAEKAARNSEETMKDATEQYIYRQMPTNLLALKKVLDQAEHEIKTGITSHFSNPVAVTVYLGNKMEEKINAGIAVTPEEEALYKQAKQEITVAAVNNLMLPVASNLPVAAAASAASETIPGKNAAKNKKKKDRKKKLQTTPATACAATDDSDEENDSLPPLARVVRPATACAASEPYIQDSDDDSDLPPLAKVTKPAKPTGAALAPELPNEDLRWLLFNGNTMTLEEAQPQIDAILALVKKSNPI